MKKTIIISILFLILGLSLGWFIFGRNTEKSNSKNTTEQSSGKKIAYYQDPMHPWYTSDKPGKAPDCGMDLVPVYEGEENTKGIKIDPTVIQNIGVTTEEVKKRTLTKEIRTVGKIDYDETRLYSINTKFMGWVEKLYVNYTGKYVSKGEKLMEIYSPDLVSTEEEYLQAVKYRKNLENSSDNVKTGADDLIQSAKRRLLYWDISEKDIAELEKSGTPKKTLPIFSPASGIITEKMIVEGDNIMTGMNLFKIADLSNVWIIADVYQFELPWIKVGQPVDIEISYLPGKNYKGKITYIYPYLGMETKTIKVRVELKNTSNYDFKPGMFANVIIKSPINIESIAVPEQAIIRSGDRDIAIISLGNGYFEPREVKLGVSANGYIQILEGLHEGEQIVTSSQFLIDSESNLKTAINQMSAHSQHNMSTGNNSQMDMQSNQNEQESTNKDKNQMNHSDHNKMNDNEMQQMNNEGQSKEKSSPLIRTGIIDLKAIDKNKDGKVYQDMMDWNVISDEPGICPICGMKLKEVTLAEAKKNLEEHGFKIK
ncbi:MAG: hypothetical protein STSR0008_13150 [Ignavibacterium sp.]